MSICDFVFNFTLKTPTPTRVHTYVQKHTHTQTHTYKNIQLGCKDYLGRLPQQRKQKPYNQIRQSNSANTVFSFVRAKLDKHLIESSERFLLLIFNKTQTNQKSSVCHVHKMDDGMQNPRFVMRTRRDNTNKLNKIKLSPAKWVP